MYNRPRLLKPCKLSFFRLIEPMCAAVAHEHSAWVSWIELRLTRRCAPRVGNAPPDDTGAHAVFESVLDGLSMTRTAGASVAVRECAFVGSEAHTGEGDIKRHLTHVTWDRRVADLLNSA